MFLKQRNPARQRRAPAVASGTPTCSSMTRHSSVQSATCLSIVTLPALGTTFLQRTAMLSALDGMGPATESRCHSNWGVRLTSCSFLNERDLTSKIVQCCTEVSFSNSRPFNGLTIRRLQPSMPMKDWYVTKGTIVRIFYRKTRRMTC